MFDSLALTPPGAGSSGQCPILNDRHGGGAYLTKREPVVIQTDYATVFTPWSTKAVVAEMRRVHPTHVFCYKGKPLQRMYNRAWREARKRAGLPHIRVHDLKHTFGRRLRSVGVSFEDRQDLLGHKSGRITTHYSRVELANLILAANKVCELQSRKSPALVILKKKSHLAVVNN
jgi:hypothetical protein